MKHYRNAGAIVAALAILGGATTQAQASPAGLTLDVARRMVAACAAKAVDKGWKMNIAVVDSGANLIAFERMDRAFLGSGEIAVEKARTSAKFPFPTRTVEELAYGKGGKAAAVPGIVHVPGIIAFAGGLPVMAAGVHVGGIGVSGASADEDEVCAQAAIDAVKKQLGGA